MNGRTIGIALAMATGAGALGCSDKSELATDPGFAKGGGSGGTTFSCQFNTLKNHVNDYFAVADRSGVQDVVTLMKSQYGTAGSAAATSSGFDLLARIAGAHDGTGLAPVGTPAAGSTLANDVIACMKTISPLPTAATDFSAALGPTGAFEVRGAAADGDAVMRTADLKGAIGAPTGGTFAGWTGERLLFYAVPTADNNFLTEPKVGFTGYSWNTIPVRHAFTGLARVAMCINKDAKDRVQEITSGVQRVLEVTDFTGLVTCSTTTGMAPTGVFGRVLQMARKLVMPTEAYAAALGGGTGGLLGGLSDLGVVTVSAVSLTISKVPDGVTTAPLAEFTVVARAPSGSTVAGVDVTINVIGNNGSYTVIGDATARTDFNGVAHFTNVRIDKPGGYTVQATSQYEDYGAQGAATSRMFHIKQ